MDVLGPGKFSLTVNGQEIPNSRFINFESHAGNIPILTMELIPTTMEIDASGVEVERITVCPDCKSRYDEQMQKIHDVTGGALTTESVDATNHSSGSFGESLPGQTTHTTD